ncbi:glucose-6-phosphate dehydrogenase [Lactiplantibacillus garii]|uniref:Glucose-6-phosphate 1-dehydrogenase n=1 Tax=Lactiplantibacillus garii TaxID=2306423 RepID=A0A3R8LKA4_9LACO|nr:glucose-6-phosphate dehydrogenase [Lactiplantibacillus garii]RRK10657.1 glucose-6-phosphate dehydrogenase [Lactiplantibacillus garii]
MSKEKIALFTIFGGTGDLAQRKLYPSLFKLYQKGYLKEHFAVIGTARRPWTNEHYHGVITDSLASLNADPATVAKFAGHFYYQSHDVTDAQHYVTLKQLSEKLDAQYGLQGNRIFYLAMAPNFFGTIAQHLRSENILTPNGFNRVIIEKPFGHDFESAKELNDQLTATFNENQIYRIDHYLGKEMIQNISAIRFGNNIWESLWNNRYISNVQVTLSEKLGVEERAVYYDNSGALRDMVQNHILQILSLLTMDQPVEFTEKDIDVEKVKALRSLRPLKPEEVATNFVRGQYAADGDVKAYRNEDKISPDSNTDTFVAGKVMIDNFRWSGVPFYVRTGKRLADKFTRIDVVFKRPIVNIFNHDDVRENDDAATSLAPNVLTINVEPTEGVELRMNAKALGQGFATTPVKLNFAHDAAATANSPEAYERLLHDALNGDATNFTHWKEVAYSWKFVDVIQKYWDEHTPDFPNYRPGSMGPDASDELLRQDGHEWIYKE